MIYQRKELKDNRWPDLQDASWSLKEIEMAYVKQTNKYAYKSSLPISSIILILMFLLMYTVALHVASFFWTISNTGQGMNCLTILPRYIITTTIYMHIYSQFVYTI
jgi:hypothetical protein